MWDAARYVIKYSHLCDCYDFLDQQVLQWPSLWSGFFEGLLIHDGIHKSCIVDKRECEYAYLYPH